MMIRRISEATGKSYKQVQSALKGVKNEHIRGDFKGSTGKGEFLFRLAAPAELRRQAAALDKKASPGAKLQDPVKRKERAKALREKARAIEQAQRALGKLGFTDSPEALGRY